MRVGLSSYTYPWAVGVPGHEPARRLGVLDLLDRAHRLGAPVLQVADNLPLHTLPLAELDLLDARARELGVALEVGTRGVGAGQLATYLALAVRLGSPLVRVVVDAAGHHPSPSEVVDLLRPHRAAFVDAGVVLAVENHDRFPAAVLARVVEELGTDWVGVCLDTANSLGALEGPAAVVPVLAPLTVNLHVKDVAVHRQPHQMGFVVEGCPVGAGMVDVPWVLGQLAAHGRGGVTAVVELWTPLTDLAETVATEERWAEQSVQHLAALVS